MSEAISSEAAISEAVMSETASAETLISEAARSETVVSKRPSSQQAAHARGRLNMRRNPPTRFAVSRLCVIAYAVASWKRDVLTTRSRLTARNLVAAPSDSG